MTVSPEDLFPTMPRQPPTPTPRTRLPPGVWALGLVSLFMDTSSEMIHSLLPVFLVGVLGASVTTVGLIEGLGEATASIVKLFSGALSDALGKRKGLTLAGYALGALSKPIFALAPTTAWVLAGRLSDRVGKGIRGAPRDALVADLTPPSLRGAAYGLRQALDSVGAVLGPLLALALMVAFAGSFRAVFWMAVIPGLAAVGILAFLVREPPTSRPTAGPQPFQWKRLVTLGRPVWAVVFVGWFFTLARFSEAFLILRAEDSGLSPALAPLILVITNVAYAGSAYPSGTLSDRMDRWRLIPAGFGVLLLADLVLAFAPGIVAVMIGVALWGLHMGITQGLLSTLVADAAPPELRATAFGLFHLVSGIALLLASVIAGVLWDRVGPQATFLAGAAFTLFGLACVGALRE